MKALNKIVTGYFTLWMIVVSVSAFYFPHYFTELKGLIKPALGVIMFGMGITLTMDDFRRVLVKPRAVFIGAAAQFLFMPFLGFALATAFGMEPLLAAGFVLLGSCPGGTASNVITYLAKGDVALSVTMTAVSTLLAPLFIPLLIQLYAGRWIDVPMFDLFVSTLQIVIVPVVLGLVIRMAAGEKVEKAAEAMPMVSALGIIVVVAIIVALNKHNIAAVGLVTALAVVLHNAGGLAVGFISARLAGLDLRTARTVAIEVGMQNSGLGVALANAHFGALAALPSAIFSVWHNLMGSGLAWWWRRSSGDGSESR